MSEQRQDPPRLHAGDTAFAELHAGLRDARARGPSAEQLARMRANLGLPPGTPSAMTSARLGWLKLALLGAAIAGAVGLWRSQRAEPKTPERAPSPSRQAHTPGSVLQTQASPNTQATPEPVPLAAERVAPPSARTTTAGAARAHPAAAPTGDPGAELALLKRAKADARSAPTEALARVAEHERRFPHGLLVEEREVIAIEALLASGQRAAGVARADRFFASFPNSAHARRVRALLAEANATQSDTKPADAPHPSR